MGEITDRQMGTKPSDKDIWLNESAPKGHGHFMRTASLPAGIACSTTATRTRPVSGFDSLWGPMIVTGPRALP